MFLSILLLLFCLYSLRVENANTQTELDLTELSLIISHHFLSHIIITNPKLIIREFADRIHYIKIIEVSPKMYVILCKITT